MPTEIDISRWYDTFGPSARDCYNQTPHSGINHSCVISDLLSDVNWVACLHNYLPQSPHSASLDESRSEDLFLVIPRYHNPFSPATVVITDHILSLFRAHHKRKFQLELRGVFELMYTHPRSRALLSHMFEDEVKLLLQKRVPRKVYSMKKGIKGSKNQVYHASEADRTWLFDLPPSPATFFYKDLDDIFPVPGLYLPKDSNEKTLDSFTVSKDTDGSIVLSYQQCTVGMKHGVHVEPLKTASAWIKAGKIFKVPLYCHCSGSRWSLHGLLLSSKSFRRYRGVDGGHFYRPRRDERREPVGLSSYVCTALILFRSYT